LKVTAALLPKDIHLNVRPLDELSDEQLLERLSSLSKRAAPFLAKLDSDDESRTESAEPPGIKRQQKGARSARDRAGYMREGGGLPAMRMARKRNKAELDSAMSRD
jgi:hypothetical protein